MFNLDYRAILLGLMLLIVTGCGGLFPHAFREPGVDMPHARVSIEIGYETTPGPDVTNLFVFNGRQLSLFEFNGKKGGVASLRVPIGVDQVKFETTFYHWDSVEETHSVPVERTEREYHSCVSTDSHGNCRDGYETRTIHESKTETVTRRVKKLDGGCAQSNTFRFEQGEAYMLHFVFAKARECALRCTHQQSQSDGSIRLEPCKDATAEEIRQAEREAAAKEEAQERRWEIGGRVGYGTPGGEESQNTSLRDSIESQTSLGFDAAYRLNPHFALGTYLQYGFGTLNSKLESTCSAAGADCRISSMSLGVQMNYHLAPRRTLDPWFGGGVGLEVLSLGVMRSEDQIRLSGWELKGQVGLDIALSPKFVVGPFAALSAGEYLSMKCRGRFCSSGDKMIDDKALHSWVFGGLKASFLL